MPRVLVLAFGIVLTLAAPAAADIGGVYIGHYVCAQRYIPLKLAIVMQPDGSLGAVFGFQPPGGAPGGLKETAYAMAGRFTPASGEFQLTPDRWVTAAPLGYTMVGVRGTYDARSDSLQGQIAAAGCTSFEVKKDPQQSAQLGQQMAAQQERVRNLPPSAITTAQFPDTCTAILTWASKVEAEYPGMDFYAGRVPDGGSKILNLYEDEYFTKFFGKTFDQLSQAERTRIGTQVMRQCLTNGQWRRSFTWQSGLDDPFLPGSVRTSQVMAAVVERRSLRQELRRVVEQLNGLPGVAPSWEQALAIGATLARFGILWPSESRTADSALTEAKRRSAGPALQARVEALLASATTLAGAHEISAFLASMARPAVPADGDLSELMTFVPADLRQRQAARLDDRISSLIEAETQRDAAIVARLGDGLAGLETGGRVFDDVTRKYGAFASSAPVRALLDLLASRRGPMLRGAESVLAARVQAAATSGELRALVSSYLDVPSDRADPVGNRLLQLAQQRNGVLQQAEAAAAAQRAEERRQASSPCASLSTLREGEEPTAREMCVAVESGITGTQSQFEEMKSTCDEVRSTSSPNPVAAMVCLVGHAAQSGGGPLYTLRSFQKIACASAASAGRPGYFCDYVLQLGTGNATMAPLVNLVPGQVQTARFVRSVGTWLFLPVK